MPGNVYVSAQPWDTTSNPNCLCTMSIQSLNNDRYRNTDTGGNEVPMTDRAHFSRLTASADAPGKVPAISRGAAGQTANLQEWQDARGVALAGITPAGDYQWKSGGSSTGTLRHASTADRTWTLPDASATLGKAPLVGTFPLNLGPPRTVPGCIDSAGQRIPGAAMGDAVSASVRANLPVSQQLTSFVAAPDVVVFRLCQFGGTPADPDGSGATYRAVVHQP